MSSQLTPHEIYHALRRQATALRITPQEAIELYAHERMLHRLSLQPEASDFVLKGAMMMLVWIGERLRTTRDIDLRGTGSNDPHIVRSIVERACQLAESDGLELDTAAMRLISIKDDAVYEGLQILIPTKLLKANIQVKIEIGFTDVITPRPRILHYPALLDGFASTRFRGYPIETTIAEKLSIMVQRGRANTRYKDYYDLYLLSRRCEFDAATLLNALHRTFAQRGLSLPASDNWPLQTDAGQDPYLSLEWGRYVQATSRMDNISWAETVAQIQSFIGPLTARHTLAQPCVGRWIPGAAWDWQP